MTDVEAPVTRADIERDAVWAEAQARARRARAAVRRNRMIATRRANRLRTAGLPAEGRKRTVWCPHCCSFVPDPHFHEETRDG